MEYYLTQYTKPHPNLDEDERKMQRFTNLCVLVAFIIYMSIHGLLIYLATVKN
jgi:hypothetical protein